MMVSRMAGWSLRRHGNASRVTERHVIAADLKLQEYRDRHKAIAAKVDALGTELAEAIDDHTAPLEIVFLEGE